ncbi:MAG: hypothetical protein QOE89_610, partial [Pseudonocardiales bacterium]|nr:hypothetical protein [Pseudonocardiales bacterium]
CVAQCIRTPASCRSEYRSAPRAHQAGARTPNDATEQLINGCRQRSARSAVSSAPGQERHLAGDVLTGQGWVGRSARVGRKGDSRRYFARVRPRRCRTHYRLSPSHAQSCAAFGPTAHDGFATRQRHDVLADIVTLDLWNHLSSATVIDTSTWVRTSVTTAWQITSFVIWYSPANANVDRTRDGISLA